MITQQLREERLAKLESAHGSPIIAHGTASYSRSTSRGANVVPAAAPIQPPTFHNFAPTGSVVAARAQSTQSNRDSQIHNTETSTFSNRHSTAAFGHRPTTGNFAPTGSFVAARTPSTQSNRNLNTNSTQTSTSSNRHSSATIDHRPITDNFAPNSPFVAARTPSTQSNRNFNTNSNRNSIFSSRRSSTGYRATPSFTMSQRLTSNSKAQREQDLLVKSTMTLIHSHKPRQDRSNTESADVQKTCAVEVRENVSLIGMSLTLKQFPKNLGFELDSLLILHDAVSGCLIQECEAVITHHTMLDANKHSIGKQRKLKVRTRISFHSRILIAKLTNICE